MWSDDELKCLEYIEKMTPEEHELRKKSLETKFLKQDIERIKLAALLLTSTEWTDEAREHIIAAAGNAADAIKSLDDKLKILELKIKTLEAST